MRKSQYFLTAVHFLGFLLIANLSLAAFLSGNLFESQKDLLTAADAQTPVTLAIRTQYNNGQPLSGMWTVLRAQNGAIVATGYSPVTFNLVPNQQYSVAVSNYQQIIFDIWSDNTRTASHPVKIIQSTTLVALYKPIPKLNQRGMAESLHAADAIQAAVVRPAKNLNVGLSETISSSDSIQTLIANAPPHTSAREVSDSITIADLVDTSVLRLPHGFDVGIKEALSIDDVSQAVVHTVPQEQIFQINLQDDIPLTSSVEGSSQPHQPTTIQIADTLNIGDSIASAAIPAQPVIHMSDTTQSYGVIVSNTTQQISAEWVKPGSQLIGDNINSITLRLQRIGSPTGNIEVGVFDADTNLKVSFGSVSIATLPAVMTDIEFTIPDLYTIVQDDRIGIRYSGGSSTEGVSVMMDKVTTDSMFDGTRSQRVRYTTSWITYDINEDLYMILKQTKLGGGMPPPTTIDPLDVYAVDQNGNQVSGVYTVIHRNDVVMAAENTPLTYFATIGATYTVTPSAYEIFQTGSYTFDHWEDNGTSARSRTITIAGPANVTAVYLHNPLGVVSVPVHSADLDGNKVSGLNFNISPSSRPTIVSEYSPLAWTLEAGTTYTITPQDYGSFIFDHWQDGNTTRNRMILPAQGMNLTAYYKVAQSGNDATPPSLTIRAPAVGKVVTTTFVTISGIASDNIGVAKVEASIDAADFQRADGLASWSFMTPSLANGTHTATIRVTDAAGNSANATTTFNVSSHPILKRTGLYVPLYMHPSGSNLAYYHAVANAKIAHPSVPMVAVINPGGGPGPTIDSYFTNAINELRGAGVTVVGYTPTKYGARDIDSIKSDITKYVSWYSIDGIMLDEFPNVVGYESKYANITSYAKSLGLKIVIGNAGTDVPQSYIGKVDAIGITEGDGFMPIPWAQYCILCTTDGWHYNYDKSNFIPMRYAINTLDKDYLREVSKWSGLLYLTDGVSPARWTNLPPYFDDLVADLDE